jgi:DNA (cytosine-5)-methyltransferase 1
MIGIDLFAGAGGLSLGAVQAGIDVKLAIENDPYSIETYTNNHPYTTVYSKDIKTFRKNFFKPPNEPLIIFGGPPCQGFSTSNQKTRNRQNPKNWLFKEFIKFVQMYSPEWIVFENVKGILDTAKGIFLDSLIKEIKLLGYLISKWILNAIDYGVPQSRSRLFVIGSKKGLKLEEPEPKDEVITVRDAIFDLPKLKNGNKKNVMNYSSNPCSNYSKLLRMGSKYSNNNFVSKNTLLVLERYKYIPQGGNWKDIPDHLMTNYKDKNRCHTGIYHRLKLNEPSVIIGNYRKNMLIHPTQNRGLSVREAARLQSFPDNYIFKGPFGFQQQQVGNAVPPMLSEIVFSQIMKSEKKEN